MSMSWKAPKPRRLRNKEGMSYIDPFENIFYSQEYPFLEEYDKIVFNKEQLEAMILGRNDSCFCGSGKKQKKCHFNINENSAVAKVWEKYFYFEELKKQKTQEKNVKFICEEGCAKCCDDYFYVSEVEYYLIKNHMLTYIPMEFEKIKAAANEQFAMLKKEENEEFTKLTSFANDDMEKISDDKENMKKFLKCVFLDERERCIIYEARPMICRFYGTSYNYNICDKIKAELEKMPKEERIAYIKKVAVDIPYGDYFRKDLDSFQINSSTKTMNRPFPLVYWLANDSKYENSYYDAISLSQNEYIRKKVNGRQ